MKYKIIIFVFTILVLYYRSIYVVFLLMLFFMEYWYFIMFLIDIYAKYNSYHKIEVYELSYDNKNLLYLWCSYCKLSAFDRLYVLLSRNRLSLSRIWYALLILFLNIPLRMLKLLYFFMFENKKSLFDGLADLHFRKFLKIKFLKIEVYEGKIFLNCYTISKLIHRIQCARQLNHDNLHQLLMNLNKTAVIAADAKPKLGEVEMKLSKLKRENSCVSGIHHYTYKYDSKHFIHSTSNVPNKINDFQKIGPAIPNMIKENSKNPGSVWSSHVTSYDEKNISKKVEIIDLHSNAFQSLGKEHIPSDLVEYHNFIFDSYKQILIDTLGPSNYSESLVRDLSNGNFSYALVNSDESSLIDEIEKWKDEHY